MNTKITYSLIVILLLVSCGQTYKNKSKKAHDEQARLAKENAEAFKVAVIPTLDCMPVYLAKQKHWFDSSKVEVRLKKYNAYIDCDTALKGKSVEISISDLKRVEYLTNQNVNLVKLGFTGAYWQLIGNRTARIKSISQMGDKMIAMTRYSATDYLTDKALKDAKVSAPVFKVQINDILTRLDMLKNNEMDAMWLPEPQATTARIYKHSVIEDSRQLNERLGVVVMRAQLLQDKNRKKQLIAFIDGYNRAVDSLNLFGVKHYADLVKETCNIDAQTVEQLPKYSYYKISFSKRQ